MANGVAVFAGIGGPEDPTVVKEITALIRIAAEARSSLPPVPLPALPPERVEASRATRPLAAAANDISEDYRRIALPDHIRRSWFRRTFLRTN
jgi:hypothetical protein